MNKKIHLVCEPFEGGRSGTSRSIKSLWDALLSAGPLVHFQFIAYSEDLTFANFDPNIKKLSHLKSNQNSIVHFLSERRVWPVKGSFVIMCHDLTPQTWPYRYGYLRALYHKFYVNFFLRRASVVICPSESIRRDLINKAGVEASRVKVIRHGINQNIFFKEEESFNMLPSDLTSRISKDFILMVSRLEHPGKNIVFAINAYSELRKSLSTCPDLVILGSRWKGSKKIFKSIQESGFSDHIHVFESLNDDLLRHFYNAAKFFFFPSVREGFALPVLESLACGTPVLLSDVPVLREFKEKGLLFYEAHSMSDCVSKMKELLQDSSFRENLNLDLNYWSWDRVAKETLSVYESLS